MATDAKSSRLDVVEGRLRLFQRSLAELLELQKANMGYPSATPTRTSVHSGEIARAAASIATEISCPSEAASPFECHDGPPSGFMQIASGSVVEYPIPSPNTDFYPSTVGTINLVSDGHGPWANLWSLAQAAKLSDEAGVTSGGSDAPCRTVSGTSAGVRSELGRTHVRDLQDPVSMGWCTIEKGRELHTLCVDRGTL